MLGVIFDDWEYRKLWKLENTKCWNLLFLISMEIIFSIFKLGPSCIVTTLDQINSWYFPMSTLEICIDMFFMKVVNFIIVCPQISRYQRDVSLLILSLSLRRTYWSIILVRFNKACIFIFETWLLLSAPSTLVVHSWYSRFIFLF